jgi:uncharacterized protein YutE (UPF0331/DUF86 family)
MQVGESAVERVIMDNLHDRYTGEGYRFFRYPGREIVPAFLGDFRPDAIAIGPEDRIVIEVKTTRGSSDPDRLSRVASLFSGHPDWKFVVVFADEEPQDRPLSNVSRTRIEREIEVAEDLADQGQLRAAFLLAWAALEAAARQLLADAGEMQNRAKPPRQILEQLEREGLLDPDSARLLWDYVQLRNATVHGDLNVDVNEVAVKSVIRSVRALLAETSPRVRMDA